jgi:hypothetical protein
MIGGARWVPERMLVMESIMGGRFCQSCAMPMPTDDLLGTEKDGSRSADYCHYCYVDGQFVTPEQTMAEMVEVCVPFMVAEGMAEEQARAIMQQMLPGLKRWRM